MSKLEDLVVLDGIEKVSCWPLELAESLLKDPMPWGGLWPGHPENGPNRQYDYSTLANCVNAYHRHPPGSQWKHPLSDPQFSEHCSTYPTQELLDAIFIISRADRFVDGAIRKHESNMRQALQEVVRRVHSATPPIFLLVADGETKQM